MGDPDLRDPDTKTPLCFPLAAMIFFAGVVDNENSAIARSVAVQIEPHGRLRVVGGSTGVSSKGQKVKIRLDGITYHPFLEFNAVPRTCAPYCFPPSKNGKKEMGSSGCTKYCTPAEYTRKSGNKLALNNCRCDMVKRLDCWIREGSPQLVCGQFKQLLKMHLLTEKRPATKSQCGEVC